MDGHIEHSWKTNKSKNCTITESSEVAPFVRILFPCLFPITYYKAKFIKLFKLVVGRFTQLENDRNTFLRSVSSAWTGIPPSNLKYVLKNLLLRSKEWKTVILAINEELMPVCLEYHICIPPSVIVLPQPAIPDPFVASTSSVPIPPHLFSAFDNSFTTLKAKTEILQFSSLLPAHGLRNAASSSSAVLDIENGCLQNMPAQPHDGTMDPRTTDDVDPATNQLLSLPCVSKGTETIIPNALPSDATPHTQPRIPSPLSPLFNDRHPKPIIRKSTTFDIAEDGVSSPGQMSSSSPTPHHTALQPTSTDPLTNLLNSARRESVYPAELGLSPGQQNTPPACSSLSDLSNNERSSNESDDHAGESGALQIERESPMAVDSSDPPTGNNQLKATDFGQDNDDTSGNIDEVSQPKDVPPVLRRTFIAKIRVPLDTETDYDGSPSRENDSKESSEPEESRRSKRTKASILKDIAARLAMRKDIIGNPKAALGIVKKKRKGKGKQRQVSEVDEEESEKATGEMATTPPIPVQGPSSVRHPINQQAYRKIQVDPPGLDSPGAIKVWDAVLGLPVANREAFLEIPHKEMMEWFEKMSRKQMMKHRDVEDFTSSPMHKRLRRK